MFTGGIACGLFSEAGPESAHTGVQLKSRADTARPGCKKLDLHRHNHDPPWCSLLQSRRHGTIGDLAAAGVTELVEEAPTSIQFKSANTSTLSRRTACVTAWEVRIWGFGLSPQGMMSSASSLATMAPATSAFLSFAASLRTPLLCLGRRLLRHQLYFRGLGHRLAAACGQT
jgi:hypothetical protein